LAGLPVRRRIGGCVAAAEGIPMSACATLLDVCVVMIMVLRAVSSWPLACRCTPTVASAAGGHHT
jgi:hypothetical protein